MKSYKLGSRLQMPHGLFFLSSVHIHCETDLIEEYCCCFIVKQRGQSRAVCCFSLVLKLSILARATNVDCEAKKKKGNTK